MATPFDQLYSAQTYARTVMNGATGAAVTAIIAGGAPLPCIPSAGNTDLIAVDGGSAMSGGYTLQMRRSDFTDIPAKGDSATVSCYADTGLMLTSSPEESHGVLTLRIGDLAAT